MWSSLSWLFTKLFWVLMLRNRSCASSSQLENKFSPHYCPLLGWSAWICIVVFTFDKAKPCFFFLLFFFWCTVHLLEQSLKSSQFFKTFTIQSVCRKVQILLMSRHVMGFPGIVFFSFAYMSSNFTRRAFVSRECLHLSGAEITTVYKWRKSSNFHSEKCIVHNK